MRESNVIDARGLSCPQPAIMATDALSTQKQGSITVLVDTDTARENVLRVGKKHGWQVQDVLSDGAGGYRITFVKP